MNLKYRFVKTCEWAPEQYDVYLSTQNKKVGYVRIRHGYLWLYCPDENEEEPTLEIKLSHEISCFKNDFEKGYYFALVEQAIEKWEKENDVN